MRFPSTRALWTGLALCAALQPAAGQAGADPAALATHHWQLREVRDAQGHIQPGWSLLPALPAGRAPRMVLLEFTRDRVTVGRLCNALSASYQLQEHTLRIGTLIGTRRACPDAAVMTLERRIGQRLPEASQWRLGQQGQLPPVLTLTFPDGDQWVLDGAPTDETRFGGPGERMFLEVAPEPVACPHPLLLQSHCLQVRNVEYDAQGLRTGTGAWENWSGQIQGYAHQPGVRNVLRVLRYPNADGPPDTPAFVYVLDMTVESEIVR